MPPGFRCTSKKVNRADSPQLGLALEFHQHCHGLNDQVHAVPFESWDRGLRGEGAGRSSQYSLALVTPRPLRKYGRNREHNGMSGSPYLAKAILARNPYLFPSRNPHTPTSRCILDRKTVVRRTMS